MYIKFGEKTCLKQPAGQIADLFASVPLFRRKPLEHHRKRNPEKNKNAEFFTFQESRRCRISGAAKGSQSAKVLWRISSLLAF